MKSSLILALSTAAVLTLTITAANANLVLNPSFEQPGSPTAPTTGFGADQDTLVPDWMNAGLHTSATGVSGPMTMKDGTVSPTDGDWMARVYHGDRSVQQTTDHVIGNGEWFELSFQGNVQGGYNPRHQVQIYWLDEQGQRQDLFNQVLQPEDFHPEGKTFYSGRDADDVAPWIEFSVTTDMVPTAAVGHNVGVWFNNSVGAHSILVDEVSLTVIPEPASLVLLGLGGC